MRYRIEVVGGLTRGQCRFLGLIPQQVSPGESPDQIVLQWAGPYTINELPSDRADCRYRPEKVRSSNVAMTISTSIGASGRPDRARPPRPDRPRSGPGGSEGPPPSAPGPLSR